MKKNLLTTELDARINQLKDKIESYRQNTPISSGLKKEIVFLSVTAASALLLGKKTKLASVMGLIGAGVAFLPTKNLSLFKKSVIITGGSRGLGLALAREFVKEGSLVTLIARDSAELQRAKNNLETLCLTERYLGEVFITPCDVTKKEEVEVAFSQVESRFGKIDYLINNAGALSAGPFDTMEIEDFEAQLKLHVISVIQAIKLVTPFFKKNKKGHIVNISSLGGLMPIPHMTSYATSKYALTGFTESVMSELAMDNISITGVYPGLMRTGSPIQAVFKGDHEKEFSVFSAGDMIPGVSVSAEYAAKTIIKGIKSGESEIIISSMAKINNFAHHNFPQTFSFLLKLMTPLLPKGQSKERKTGAEIRTVVKKKLWYLPFSVASSVIEEDLNQKEKLDAEFNLNVKN